MFNDKILKSVAEAVKNVLQQEALKGQQHKIDKNKNNKIDAHDFKILRGEKKGMKKEEIEQIDELSKKTLSSYTDKVIDKTRTMPQGPKKEKHMTGLMTATNKQLVKKEETEQIKLKEQGVAEAAKWRHDDLEGKTWRRPDWDDGDLSPSKIKINRSGKDVDDSGDELTSRPGAWRGKADMAKRMTKKGVPTKSELAFQDNLKMRMRMKKKEGELDEVNNPFDLKNYKSQLPTKPGEKAGFDSKKISTGTVYSRKPVKDEKPLKEEDAYDKDRYAVKDGKAVKDNPGHMGSANYKDQAHHVWASSAEEAMKKKGMKEEASNDEFHAEVKKAKEKSLGKQTADVAKPAVSAVKQESVEQIDEKHMTPGEMKKREKIVKSMKKGMQGFKDRYGDKAKNVMYATATKQAMKD